MHGDIIGTNLVPDVQLARTLAPSGTLRDRRDVFNRSTGEAGFMAPPIRVQPRDPSKLNVAASTEIDELAAIHRPLVSAVIPAFDAETFLERTVNSLLAQTYSNLEIIIVDDGSTDRTLEIAKNLQDKHPQVRVRHQPHSGVAAARNAGVRLARGTFIAPVDADDVWFPQAVESLLQVLLEGDGAVGVTYCWLVNIDEDDRLNGRYRASRIEGDVSSTLVCHNFIGAASATMIRRADFEATGGYDARFKASDATGCEDWDLYLRLAERCQFRVAPDFHVGYRKSRHAMSTNADRMLQSHRLMLQALLARRPDVPFPLLRLSHSSFCLYLADEAYRRRRFNNSAHLLRQALASSVLFTVLRVNFFRLLLANTWRIAVPRRPSSSQDRRTMDISLQSIRSRRWSRSLKMWIEILLHRWATSLDGKKVTARDGTPAR